MPFAPVRVSPSTLERVLTTSAFLILVHEKLLSAFAQLPQLFLQIDASVSRAPSMPSGLPVFPVLKFSSVLVIRSIAAFPVWLYHETILRPLAQSKLS